MAADRKASGTVLLLAEFASPVALYDALAGLRRAGYRAMETYSPFPLDRAPCLLAFRDRRLAWTIALGAILGAVAGLMIPLWGNAIDYPINVGGRPLAAWPAFLLLAYETAILGAALAALFGMLWLNDLPRLHHPVFDAHRFRLATSDRFFLSVHSADERYDAEDTRRLLERFAPVSVVEVAA